MQPVHSTCTDWAGASFRQLKEVEKCACRGIRKPLAKKQNSSQWEGKEGAAVMTQPVRQAGSMATRVEGGRSHGQGREDGHTLSMRV